MVRIVVFSFEEPSTRLGKKDKEGHRRIKNHRTKHKAILLDFKTPKQFWLACADIGRSVVLMLLVQEKYNI